MAYDNRSRRNDPHRCSCRGECGSRWCLGWLTWGKPCNTRPRQPHPVWGEPVQIIGRRCQFCREAAARTAAARDRMRERIQRTDGHTASLFALVAGGGLP